MNNIEFHLRSKFNDDVHYICVKEDSFGLITRGYLYSVHMYINNRYIKTYENILVTSYTDLQKQINILYDNF